MKCIFIDTNNYMYSAISSRPEHKIESYEKLKDLLKKKEAKLLVPEVVALEFETRVDDIYSKAKEYFKNLDESIKKSETPLLEGEKEKMLKMTRNILKEKDKKYIEMRDETKKLFYKTNYVEIIELNSEILLNTFIRFLKRKMPFKPSKDEKLTRDSIFMQGFSDALIVESLRYFIKSMKSPALLLIFCSANIKDFALYNEKSKKHVIHPDIAKDIPTKKIIYYRNIPEMLEAEFREILSAKTKKDIERAKELVASAGSLDEALSATGMIGELLSRPSALDEALRAQVMLSELLSRPSALDKALSAQRAFGDYPSKIGKGLPKPRSKNVTDEKE